MTQADISLSTEVPFRVRVVCRHRGGERGSSYEDIDEYEEDDLQAKECPRAWLTSVSSTRFNYTFNQPPTLSKIELHFGGGESNAPFKQITLSRITIVAA